MQRPAVPNQDPQRLLQDIFGHAQFRPMQREIIDHILARRSALVVLSTGSGKSLCYQLPALMFDGLTVVVSPLISLMQDQVEALRERGIAAAFYNSTLRFNEREEIGRGVRAGQIKLLYVAPEGLVQNRILRLLDEARVSCIAIDEAHCISQWGHDFRPEYRGLGALRRRFPDAVCVALTATATRRVQEDIRQTLGIAPEYAFVGSFDRENLHLSVEPRVKMHDQIAAFLKEREGQSGIIYCPTKKMVDSLAEKLTERGFSALPYHAGMENEAREENQTAFLDGSVQIMVATVAFGMGIDKEDVRFVLHAGLPQSPEAYYQEIGRAGRDGKRADCLWLFGYSDANMIQRFIEEGAPSEREGRLERLNWLLNWAYSSKCRRRTLLAYFGEEREQERCGMCDNCDAEEEPQEDLTIPAQKFMSCVVRTRQMFGEAYIIDVLKGSNRERIRSNRHHELSVYGIGTEFSKAGWQLFSFQLLKRGMIRRDMQHGSLKMTSAGWDVLRGHEPFMCAAAAPVRSSSGGASRRSASSAGPSEYDEELFQKLYVKRKEIGDEEDIPAFFVFHESNLKEMASRLPQTEEAFLEIPGVGPSKLERYGGAFLQIIRAHCQEREENEAEPPAIMSSESASRRISASSEGAALNSGAAEFDEELFEKLRAKRKEIADEENVSAFVVFYSSILKEMASRLPQTEEAFLDISGVGPSKLEKYGGAFLQIIRAHCQERGENEAGA